MQRRTGLRLKVNLVLVPVVAFGIALMVWADYHHEYATLMQAHGAHVSPVGVGTSGGPIDPWTLPGAATRRSLRMHLVYGGLLLGLLVLAVNAVLEFLILRPVALMQRRLAGLQRGQWRGPVEAGGDDELGTLYENFQRLGPEIDALVGQVLRAERLAALALVSKRFELRVEPEVRRIGGIAARLTASDGAAARADGEELGRAAAAILHAVHEHDAAFVLSATRTRACEKDSFTGAA